MDKIISRTSSEPAVKSAAALGAKEAEAAVNTMLEAVHRLPGRTSEADLARQLGSGQLRLFGRFLLAGEDVSLVIWGTGIQCWTDCELAPNDHPLRTFVDQHRELFQRLYESLATDADDTLVLVGRWVDFFGDAPGTLVIYLRRLVIPDWIGTALYTGEMDAWDPTLGGPRYPLMLPGHEVARDKGLITIPRLEVP